MMSALGRIKAKGPISMRKYDLAIVAAGAFALVLGACATAGEDPPGTNPDATVDPNDPDANVINPPDAAQSPPDAMPPPPDAAPVAVPITITQSNSQSIVAANSVSCNNGDPTFHHTENSYYRQFNLAAFGITSDFMITSVDVGIEDAIAGSGGNQPATVNLYTLTGAFITANLTLIGSAPILVADQTATILPIGVSGTAPAGSTLVVEFLTPDGQPAQHRLFVGSNDLGETGSSFLKAADCSINEPTAAANLGIPGLQMHMVMNVHGMHFP
jgi:hypothetical protein